jgi:hypothetical protein
MEPGAPEWRRSTLCDSGQCVEIARLDDAFLVRDSKDPDGPMLRFGRSGWGEFIEGIREGGFQLS